MKSISVLQNRYESSHLSPLQIRALTRLRSLLRKYQQEGVLEQLLSGTEALDRYADDLEVLSSSQYGTDIWLSSTGYQLSYEKALAYHKAGLAGIFLNLDHFEPDKHNALQRYKHAYGWVLKAADSIRKANLLLGFKLCPSQDFISRQNLFTYTRLAYTLGAKVIQIQGPTPTGLFTHCQASLDTAQLQVIDEFAETINYAPEFKSWPIINIMASHEQNSAKKGAEKTSMFIDAGGSLNYC